jgi:hypothetical protein
MYLVCEDMWVASTCAVGSNDGNVIYFCTAPSSSSHGTVYDRVRHQGENPTDTQVILRSGSSTNIRGGCDATTLI